MRSTETTADTAPVGGRGATRGRFRASGGFGATEVYAAGGMFWLTRKTLPSDVGLVVVGVGPDAGDDGGEVGVAVAERRRVGLRVVRGAADRVQVHRRLERGGVRSVGAVRVEQVVSHVHYEVGLPVVPQPVGEVECRIARGVRHVSQRGSDHRSHRQHRLERGFPFLGRS